MHDHGSAKAIRTFATAPERGDGGVIVGLVGDAIGGSGSPMLHQKEADAQGLRLVYRLLDLGGAGSELASVLTAAESVGFAGLNITHPYKQAILPLLDRLSPEAQTIGAVNTVVFGNDARVGHNTDAAGFSDSFTHRLGDVPRGVVVQLGAGGAGAATAVALLKLGVAHIRLVDSMTDRATQLAERLNPLGLGRVTAMTDPRLALAGADGLVNATPIGMAHHPGLPIDPGLLRSDLWVADIIYFPASTHLLRAANALGCRTMNGSSMVAFQAARAFDLFTGLSANRDRMLANADTLLDTV